MTSKRLKPKIPPLSYALDPSVTGHRLDDLQRMFGMHTFPFSLSPNPDYLYVAGVTARALAKTTYAIDQHQGLSVIIGDNGLGKSMLARYLYHAYTIGDVRAPSIAAYIPDPPFPGSRELMKRIIQELGGKSGNRTTETIMEDLQKMVLHFLAAGRTCLIMIEEAQGLTRRQLEVVRDVLDYNPKGQAPMQVVLFGTEDLRMVLYNTPELNERVAARSTLEPFTAAETVEMISYRLIRSGCRTNLFLSDALDLIYDLSNGYPGKAIELAGAALWYAVEFGIERINSEVLEVVGQRTRNERQEIGS